MASAYAGDPHALTLALSAIARAKAFLTRDGQQRKRAWNELGEFRGVRAQRYLLEEKRRKSARFRVASGDAFARAENSSRAGTGYEHAANEYADMGKKKRAKKYFELAYCHYLNAITKRVVREDYAAAAVFHVRLAEMLTRMLGRGITIVEEQEKKAATHGTAREMTIIEKRENEATAHRGRAQENEAATHYMKAAKFCRDRTQERQKARECFLNAAFHYQKSGDFGTAALMDHEAAKLDDREQMSVRVENPNPVLTECLHDPSLK